MNVLRPLQTSAGTVLSFLVAHVASLLQIAGFGLIIAACSVLFGVLGGLISGGVVLLLVGALLERAE